MKSNSRREVCRRYYQSHKDQHYAAMKKWFQENPDKRREYSKSWRQKNLAAVAAYVRNRRRSDLNFRLRCQQSERIRQVIKGQQKPARTMELVGCSVAFLRSHLESLFQPGMTWENQGAWHVDHKLPLASFNLQDPEQLRAACHWSNLQPLWAGDNLRKGAKTPTPKEYAKL